MAGSSTVGRPALVLVVGGLDLALGDGVARGRVLPLDVLLELRPLGANPTSCSCADPLDCR